MFRYERYLKSGCLDLETFVFEENRDNISIEEEMDNIDAQKPVENEKKAEVLALTDDNMPEDSAKPDSGERREDRRHDTKSDQKAEQGDTDESEVIISSASSSLAIDAEDSGRRRQQETPRGSGGGGGGGGSGGGGTKRISVRASRQNFFSIETFSPRY